MNKRQKKKDMYKMIVRDIERCAWNTFMSLSKGDELKEEYIITTHRGHRIRYDMGDVGKSYISVGYIAGRVRR